MDLLFPSTTPVSVMKHLTLYPLLVAAKRERADRNNDHFAAHGFRLPVITDRDEVDTESESDSDDGEELGEVANTQFFENQAPENSSRP